MAESDNALNLVPAPADHDLFSQDRALIEAVERHAGPAHLARLRDLGRLAGATRSQQWAEAVEASPPVLRTHDAFGRRTDELEYHPAWHELLQAGVGAALTAAPWERDTQAAAHTARAAGLVVWSQLEAGHISALSTTYAAVPALRSDPDLERVWLPRLASRAYEAGLRPPADKLGCLAGVAATERHAGSDLQAATTVARAEPASGGSGPLAGGPNYRLVGQKWFVSSPMSDVFVTLAQTPGGVTCFLLPRVLDDGSQNPFRIMRAKRLVGTRSNPPVEVEFADSWALRLGEEGRGLRALTGMLSAARLDNVLRSAGQMRLAVTRAVHHTRLRAAFGSPLVEQPLMQNVLADLAMESEAATALAMRLAAAVDASETDLLRCAVPVAKFWVCKRAQQVVGEAVECLGGNGYVEEHGLGRVYRDALVGPLWEGPGNVSALDVLKAMTVQPRSMEVLLAEIDLARGADQQLDRAMDDVANFLHAASREARRDPAAVEAGARWMVERLAVVLQASLLVRVAPPAVSSTFLTSRVAGGGGVMFGTLPVGRRVTQTIVERALQA